MEKKLIGMGIYLFGIFASTIGSVMIIKIKNHRKLGWLGCAIFTSGFASIFASFGFLLGD
jgi:hypothetical protein